LPSPERRNFFWICVLAGKSVSVKAMKELKIGKRVIRLPASRLLRTALGVGLVIGGLLWFLPVVGLWMLPLGLAVLAVDIPALRPLSRRINTWISRLVDRIWRKK